MTTKPFVRAAWLVLLLSTIGYQPPTLLGQGSLTPPGAPAPTMKSLDQIEARKALAGGTSVITISQSGSYYLTGNLTVATGDAVTINASQVTLDLNGFVIRSTAPTANGYGVLLSSGSSDIHITNGHIQGGVTYSGTFTTGPGFVSGILGASLSTNIQISRITVSGVSANGIYLSDVSLASTSSVVDHCTISVAGNVGIRANTVTDSMATKCGMDGIRGYNVTNSSGESVGNGVGLLGTDVTNCSGFATVVGTTGTGINAFTANNSYALSEGGPGIDANVITNCYGFSKFGDGVTGGSANNCFGQSTNGAGIAASVATSCYGTSQTGGQGIWATNALGSFGIGTIGQGISATTATNCYGVSDGDNRGISCEIANGCYGISAGGSYGIFATQLAFLSYGKSGSGTGLKAHIVNSCVGSSTSGTAIIYDNHYNVPPNNYPSP